MDTAEPSAFMQNIVESAAAIRHGVLPQTSGKGMTGWIDTHDVAAVAARVLVEDRHDGRAYVLLGRRIRYLHLPSPVSYALLRLTGSDDFTARGLRH